MESFCRANPGQVVKNLKLHLDSHYYKDQVEAARRDLNKRVQ